jgi:hypothetical protein
LLPSSGVPLPPGAGLQAGVAFAQLSIEGALKAPTVTGVLTLNNTKLTGFNLEERLSGVEGLDLLHIDRDLGIDALRSKVQMGPEKVMLTEIEVDLPQVGIIAGQGVIDANRTLDFQMSAVRHGTSDKRAIPFVVRGPCIAPIFRPPGKI